MGQEMLLPRAVGVFFWTGRNEDVVLFDLLASALPDDGVYLDVGGNVGLYVTALTKAKAGRLRAVAFEPIAATVEIMKQTFALNGVTTAKVEQFAVSSGSGVLRLSNFPGGWNNFWVADPSKSVPQIEVRTQSIDSWMLEHPDLVPDAMKIDVEGHEFEVLKGARETLRRYKPTLVVECHCSSWAELGVSRGEFVELVRSLGYPKITKPDGQPVDLLTEPNTIHVLLSNGARRPSRPAGPQAAN
jgi:FkbM family methyltransferase